MNRKILAVALAGLAFAAAPVLAAQFDYGLAGLFSRANSQTLAPLTLSSGKPLAAAEYELKSGGYYEIRIVADGTAELAISGAEFFRNIWIDEIVINDIEVRPMGIHSLEFDDEGEAEISFIAIKPGSYELRIPGTRGDSQRAVFHIR